MKRLLFCGVLAGCAEDPTPLPPTEEATACRPGELDHPQAVAVDGDRLLVANTGYGQPWARGSLAIVDPATARVEAVLPTTWQNPQALVRAHGAWWVADTGLYDFTADGPRMGTPGGLDRLDPTGFKGFELPRGPEGRHGGPIDLVAVGDRLFVSSAISASIYLFDLTRETWIRGTDAPITYGDGLGLGSLATDGERVYVVDYNADQLHVLDARTGARLGCHVPLGEAEGLEGAKAPLVVGRDLYYVLDQAGLLRRIDLDALPAEAPPGPCSGVEPETVAVTGLLPNHLASDGEHLVLVHSGENNVVVLRRTDFRPVAVHVLPPGSNPWHAVVVPAPAGTAPGGLPGLAVSEWGASGVTLIEPTGRQRRLRCGDDPGGDGDAPPDDRRGDARLADVVRAAPSADDGPFGDPAATVNGVRGAGASRGGQDVFSLGTTPGIDDHVVLCWSGGPILDGPGPDLVVFENPFRGFLDPVVVEVSPDGERWVAFPHDYQAADETAYDPDPTRWVGFAGVTPVWLHEEENPVDPFGPAAGGDAFDLAVLDDEALRDQGAACVRLTSAQARTNPDTGRPFPVDPISDGADVDGVYGAAGAVIGPLGLVVLLAQGADHLTISAPPAAEPATATHLRLEDSLHLRPTLEDVLSQAPGAVVRRSGGTRATLQLRGAGGHQVKLLLDGIALDDGRGGALDLAHLPLTALEAVTVRRGAAAAAYGTGAQGGVVELHTRRRPLQQMRLQIGNFGERQSDAALVERLGPGDLLAAVSAATATGDFPYLDVNGQRRTRRNNGHARLDGLLRLRVPLPGGGARLLLSGLSLGRGEPGLEQFEQVDAHSHARHGLAAVAADVEGPGGLALGAQVQALSRWFDSADPTPAFAGAARRFALADTARAVRVQAETRPARAQVGLLLEGSHQTATTRTEGGDTPGRRSEGRLGGAAALTGRLRPTPALLAQATVRVDDTDARAPLVVPAGGVEFRWEFATLRANAGRLFRDPGFDELYFEAAGLRGNPDLRPEDGWGGDVGVELAGTHGAVELTGFLQRYDRLILYTPVNAWLIQPSDEHGAEARGLELAAHAPVGPLRARLSGLLQRVTQATGPPVPFRPQHALAADLRWPGPVAAFAAWQWRGGVTTDPFGHRSLPDQHRIDLGIHLHRGPATLAFEVRNLLDSQRDLDAIQQPLPGRSLHLGVAFAP